MSRPFHLRARFVFPIDRPPFGNGLIRVEGQSIAGVGTGTLGESGIDLGDVALFPAFINTHTHSELTDLAGQVPHDSSFADWIERLLAARAGIDSEAARRASIRDGITQSLAAGVGTIGDIVYGPWAHEEILMGREWIRTVAFTELLGFTAWEPDAPKSIVDPGRPSHRHGQRVGVETLICPLDIGVSPHAPYSTSTDIYRWCVTRSCSIGWAIATHLAETREEIEFLRDGTGPLRELLDSRDFLPAGWQPPGCSPVEFAGSVGLLDVNPLLAHVNYITDEELALLASHEVHVAFCPRTHRFFRHEPHRFREMLAAGINVCIGTDSLASNPSLSVLEELQFLRREHPDVQPQTLLEMGTIRGARALRLERLTGSIALGKQADLVALRVTAKTPADALEEILAGETSVHSVYVAGRQVWPAA